LIENPDGSDQNKWNKQIKQGKFRREQQKRLREQDNLLVSAALEKVRAGASTLATARESGSKSTSTSTSTLSFSSSNNVLGVENRVTIDALLPIDRKNGIENNGENNMKENDDLLVLDGSDNEDYGGLDDILRDDINNDVLATIKSSATTTATATTTEGKKMV